jgi:hypothetical protein
MRHDLSGNCEKCDELFDKYPGFHQGLREWFKKLQKKCPEAHISCAGRGKEDQENAVKWGASRAHYGQSAHNYNAALDIFRLLNGQTDYNKDWFRNVISGAVIRHNTDQGRMFEIDWYGLPGASFKELPHCEVENWQALKLTLVEKE